MTQEQANEIIARYRVWPFQRLTPEQVTELEQAYKVVRHQQQQDMFDTLGEGRF